MQDIKSATMREEDYETLQKQIEEEHQDSKDIEDMKDMMD